MKLIPGEVAVGLKRQFSIFNAKHNWIMTWLYIMTFGSFIGFSMAFPLLIRVVFGTMADGQTANPEAPNPFTYAWLGPLVGSLIRPVGGWLSDKWTGAKVTQLSTAVMILSTLGVAHYVKLANGSDTPQEFFFPFLALFLMLFLTSGIGNGSTFRMIGVIFEPAQAGPAGLNLLAKDPRPSPPCCSAPSPSPTRSLPAPAHGASTRRSAGRSTSRT